MQEIDPRRGRLMSLGCREPSRNNLTSILTKNVEAIVSPNMQLEVVAPYRRRPRGHVLALPRDIIRYDNPSSG